MAKAAGSTKKSQTKTAWTGASVDDFIAAVPDPVRREEAKKLRALMERVTGLQAEMWGPSIIGFGRYHYRYESGHEGDAPRSGFSPRARETVVYLVPGFESQAERLKRLGKHRVGKSCLYLGPLEKVDLEVLEEMIAESHEEMNRKYPEGA